MTESFSSQSPEVPLKSEELQSSETLQSSEATQNSDAEEVVLRCNHCNRPIRPEEAVHTPTGYRCKDCIKSQQRIFDTTTSLDLVLGAVVAIIFSLIGSFLVPALGWLSLLVAPSVGYMINNATRLVVHRRRSDALNKVLLWGAILGALPAFVVGLIAQLAVPGLLSTNLAGLIPLLWQAVYIVLVAGFTYSNARGIRL